MRTLFAAVLLLSVCLLGCGSHGAMQNVQTVTTTATTTTDQNVATIPIASQTANNTSASSTFQNQINGNLGSNNVSKVDVHSLLYSGTTTKVFAQLLLWFGQSGHVDVGYNSADPEQVHRQITDMISRGIDGVIIDWYGPNNSIDQATQAVMHEAEKHPSFSFSIMVDAGAIGASSCSGCTPEQTLVQLLKYVEQNYFISPAYFTMQGQPMVTDFNVDRSYSIDWNAVKSALGSSPGFLFQDDDGFGHAFSDGSYSWVMPQAGDYGAGLPVDFLWHWRDLPEQENHGRHLQGL